MPVLALAEQHALYLAVLLVLADAQWPAAPAAVLHVQLVVELLVQADAQ